MRLSTGRAWRPSHDREELLFLPVLHYQGAYREGIREELRRLPDKYRTVLHLYYYEDMTTEEIARLLDRSPATVRSQLMRGRDRLRVLLEEG